MHKLGGAWGGAELSSQLLFQQQDGYTHCCTIAITTENQVVVCYLDWELIKASYQNLLCLNFFSEKCL